MNLKIKISILVLLFSSIGNSQIDTLAIAKELNTFKASEDHKNFWKTIYRHDQSFRGKETVDTIDLRNIVKASMYFNKYGYPTIEQAGKESSIIKYVWIHNSTPKIDELTFKIFFSGYLTKRFSEENFRNYFIKSIYARKFDDKGYKTDPIKSIFKNLNLEFSERINIAELLVEYRKSQDFLLNGLTEYGLWISETTYDTLYLDGKPIVNEIKSDPIRISKDTIGYSYIEYLFDDGSYYPRKIIQDNNNNFRLFEQSKDYYRILSNGDLEYVNKLDQKKRYTPYNN